MKTILYGLLILVAALPGSLANAQTEFPFPGKSWGGIVRGGAGQEYDRITILSEMEPIVILERTDTYFNGYPWFKISYRGQIGYHWGGIICPNHISMVGTFRSC